MAVLLSAISPRNHSPRPRPLSRLALSKKMSQVAVARATLVPTFDRGELSRVDLDGQYNLFRIPHASLHQCLAHLWQMLLLRQMRMRIYLICWHGCCSCRMDAIGGTGSRYATWVQKSDPVQRSVSLRRYQRRWPVTVVFCNHLRFSLRSCSSFRLRLLYLF